MLIISIPLFFNNLPVIPLTSQLGDHLARIAFLILCNIAISSALFAPLSNSSVISRPVTDLRYFLSGQVSYTLPFFLLAGGRGQDSPPSISGHIKTGLSPVSDNNFCADLDFTILPCQRQRYPNRQAEMSIISKFYSQIFRESRVNLCLGVRHAVV